MKKTKKLLSLVIAILLSMASINHEPVNTVQAASKYITVKEFAKALATECKLKPVDKPLVDGYVDALMVAGIIKDGDFTKYTANLTRGDATVLIGRADEYLNKPKIKESLIQTVIDKRITDIDKIKEAKRVDFAKGYITRILKGLFGRYIHFDPYHEG